MTTITTTSRTLGLATMRNEDGTHWWDGSGWTTSRRHARALTEDRFRELRAQAVASRANDCPDNGFFGAYNVRFTPLA